MIDTSATLVGNLEPWPSKERLSELLESRGLSVYLGNYSVQIRNIPHTSFSFESYGGNVCDPQISADSDSPEKMFDLAKDISNIFIEANIKHRFEIYNHKDELAFYLHHQWPHV